MITFQNVYYKYPSNNHRQNFLLNDISFQLKKGDFLGVVGANGSGKTTLIKLLIGLLKPTKGKIVFALKEGLSNRLSNINMGYAPQIDTSKKYYPLRVEDVVLSGLTTAHSFFPFRSKHHIKCAHDALDKLGLLPLSKKSVLTLSGGQLQCVFIARALVSNPDVIVLDEPTTYLDNHLENKVNALLSSISKKKLIIMVSHDLHFISASVNRLLCISDGNAFFHESTELSNEVKELLYNPHKKIIKHHH